MSVYKPRELVGLKTVSLRVGGQVGKLGELASGRVSRQVDDSVRRQTRTGYYGITIGRVSLKIGSLACPEFPETSCGKRR